MALSDEQNAMLRLLASGEQGYDDIAALMGLSVDEVRAKVVGALAQLEAEGKPTPAVPPPLPGGAKPAAEVAPPEPEPVEKSPQAEAPAEPVVADSVAPKTPPAPKPVAPKAKPAASVTAASPPPSGGRTITLPSGRNAWLLGGGILAALAVIVVIVLVASGGGSDNSSSTAPTAATTATEEPEATEEGKAEEAAAGGSKESTQAELVAVDGSEAAGLATFGRVKNKLALQIEASGLEPTKATESYAIWLAQSPKRMVPLASTAVKSSGKGAGDIAAEFEVPIEILAYLATGTFDQIAITRVQNSQFEASINKATKEKTTPAYTGEPVLRGTIHGKIVGLATREEEKKKEEGE